MKTLNFKLIALLFGMIIFAFSSCKKPDPDAQSAEDEARSGAIFRDAFALGNNEAGGGGGKANIPECMNVDPVSPGVLTITFDNCSFWGVTRNGIMHVSYTVPNPDQPRAVNVTITFEDYTHNNIQIEGTIVSQFGGTYTVPEITVSSNDMKATFPDNRTITWSSDLVYKMTEGFGDGNVENNIIELSGTTEGINREGESYEAEHNAVTVDRSCDYGYPVSGTTTITSDKGTTTINYGNGTCDNEIEVTNSGVTITITLN